MKVAEPEPRCFQRRGSLPPSKAQYKFSLECLTRMIDGWLRLRRGWRCWRPLRRAKDQKTTFSDDWQHLHQPGAAIRNVRPDW